VVEERGRQKSVVVLNGDLDDEGSQAVHGEGSENGGVGSGDGGENSGEDEDSGDETEGNVRKKAVQGDRHEEESDRTEGITNKGDVTLTCRKSTKNAIMQVESLPAANVEVDKGETGIRPVEKVVVLASSTEEEERDDCGVSGTKFAEVAVFSNQHVGVGGPNLEVVCLNDVADNPRTGPSSSGPDPLSLGHEELGQNQSDPVFLGVLVEEGEYRDSSISEPEEVVSAHRSKHPKASSRIRKQKSGAKSNNLGVPKFIQLGVAVKEVGGKIRKRRQRGGGVSMGEVDDVERTEDMAGSVPVEASIGGEEGSRTRVTCATPASGINLISGSELSRVPESQLQSQEVDREKLIEAAKLLSIQKEVGFTFEEPTTVTIKQLVIQETCDMKKKMDWEQREGDQ
jgi:hypothetical protein